MICECYFCGQGRFSLNKQIGLYGTDWIIYEDDYIFITPDISPILKGHFLVVSKTHINSFGNGGNELFCSLQRATEIIKDSLFPYENVLYFEHGAVKSHTAGGCIDHAHVHLIPLDEPFDVDLYLHNTNLLEKEKKIRMTYDTIHNMAINGKPYIAYGYCKNDIWVRRADWLPSQFVRMMISSRVRRDYNWKITYRTEDSRKLFEDTIKLALPLMRCYNLD